MVDWWPGRRLSIGSLASAARASTVAWRRGPSERRLCAHPAAQRKPGGRVRFSRSVARARPPSIQAAARRKTGERDVAEARHSPRNCHQRLRSSPRGCPRGDGIPADRGAVPECGGCVLTRIGSVPRSPPRSAATSPESDGDRRRRPTKCRAPVCPPSVLRAPETPRRSPHRSPCRRRSRRNRKSHSFCYLLEAPPVFYSLNTDTTVRMPVPHHHAEAKKQRNVGPQVRMLVRGGEGLIHHQQRMHCIGENAPVEQRQLRPWDLSRPESARCTTRNKANRSSIGTGARHEDVMGDGAGPKEETFSGSSPQKNPGAYAKVKIGPPTMPPHPTILITRADARKFWFSSAMSSLLLLNHFAGVYQMGEV